LTPSSVKAICQCCSAAGKPRPGVAGSPSRVTQTPGFASPGFTPREGSPGGGPAMAMHWRKALARLFAVRSLRRDLWAEVAALLRRAQPSE
jgi:hypothetical protein